MHNNVHIITASNHKELDCMGINYDLLLLPESQRCDGYLTKRQ